MCCWTYVPDLRRLCLSGEKLLLNHNINKLLLYELHSPPSFQILLKVSLLLKTKSRVYVDFSGFCQPQVCIYGKKTQKRFTHKLWTPWKLYCYSLPFVWQVFPINPAEQLQTKLFPSLKHFPPFLQEFGAHWSEIEVCLCQWVELVKRYIYNLHTSVWPVALLNLNATNNKTYITYMKITIKDFGYIHKEKWSTFST